jgi:hypothetical protein
VLPRLLGREDERERGGGVVLALAHLAVDHGGRDVEVLGYPAIWHVDRKQTSETESFIMEHLAGSEREQVIAAALQNAPSIAEVSRLQLGAAVRLRAVAAAPERL